MFLRSKSTLPTPDEALPGRALGWFELPERHSALDAPLVTDEVPEGLEVVIFGLGCFWGAEEVFWQVPGVWSTSVGYAGGITPNPSYEEVCTGRTGHTEAVREVHDPTQGMRQGNDMGTQYRSAIYVTTPEQEKVAREVTARYQPELTRRGFGEITTEIGPAGDYYYAEEVHQQYLLKNPFGYRCHATSGVPVPRD